MGIYNSVVLWFLEKFFPSRAVQYRIRILMEYVTFFVESTKREVLFRPEVLKAAAGMEQVLRENDKKKGDQWKKMSCQELFHLLEKNMNELENELEELPLFYLESEAKNALKKCVDIMNYAMFLINVLS